ncbi:MAG TPA: VCBS repeat-containing protein [Thermoanaerobaculia bacterium]|nr:VCBS repeat-containing protein [Thermoanaerobaculia bacterium]
MRNPYVLDIPRLRRGLPAALAAAALAFAGCASAPPADTAGETASAEAAAPAADGERATASVTPEQLQATLETAAAAPATPRRAAAIGPESDPSAVTGWLDDPEKGRRYYLARIPKESIYRRLPDGSVRTMFGGITVAVDSEDAEWIYYRIYDVSDIQVMSPRAPMSDEAKAAVAATYAFETASGDRLGFAPFGAGLPRSGQWRNGFEIVDIDGDGHLDIVHGSPRKRPDQGPVVFLGDGAGNWRQWTEATFPQMRYDYGDIAVADFDGDGRLDVALAMHLLGMTAMVQQEPGVFRPWSEGLNYRPQGRGTLMDYSARTIEAADWNEDGRPDLVVLGEGPKMAMGTTPQLGAAESYGAVVYLNQGDGSWRRIDRGTGREHLFGDDLEVVDLDADGRLDFIAGTSAMSRADVLHLASGDTWEPAELELRPRGVVGAVSSGDFDRDGAVDVAVGYLAYEGEVWRTGIDLFLRRGDGGWERRAVWNEESRRGVTALDAGDLDGDGRLDLVSLDQDGRFQVWLGAGDGRFVAEASEELPSFRGCTGYHVEITDLDGDGRGDLVAGFAGEAGSEVIFDPGAPTQCQNEGALVALRSAAGGTP